MMAGDGQGRQAARVAAALCAVGCLLCVLVLTLPPDVGTVSRSQATAAAALCAATSACCLLAGRAHLVWPLHLSVLAGTGLITWSVAASGGGAASATAAVSYVWISIYAFAYFGWRPGAAHVTIATAAFTGALMSIGETEGLAFRVVLTMSTIAGSGIVVGALMARVQRLAETDGLTGVPNRRAYEQALERATRRERRSYPLTIALLDLDGFKVLNDTFGHEAGDQVLRDAAEAWRRLLRRGDTLARLGGDEFAVILPACGPSWAREVAQRLIDATPSQVTSCVGLVIWDGSEPMSDVARRADKALYRAKRTRPGSYAGGLHDPAALRSA